jgi:hypothetical protein
MALSYEDKRWIADRFEAAGTRLLASFQEWASPVDTRLRARLAVVRMLDLEQEALRDRMDKPDGGSPGTTS